MMVVAKKNICKEELVDGGVVCGAKLVYHNKLENYVCCDNPKCRNYYICRCGVEFGKHETS